MKNSKGITLVALVVTIIVLIILAGISINLVLGDNGIITIAKKAKENAELAKTEEETALNRLYEQTDNELSSIPGSPYEAIAKLAEFKTAIANYIEEAGGIKPEESAEAPIFGDSIKGIVKEVTKNATATADNISEGKTAWINGELITGNGADNKSHYDQAKSDISITLSNLVVYGYEYHNASSNNHGTAYGKGSCSSKFEFDLSNFSTITIGTVSDSSAVLVMNNNDRITLTSSSTIDVSNYESCRLEISLSYSGSAADSGSSSSSSKTCTISSITFS